MTARTAMACIGVLGGTFDPIHYGHLRTALELEHALSLAEVRFVPSGRPPHRGAPRASGRLRLDMVRAAVAGRTSFVADDRELGRDGPSYTVDTLASLREELGRAASLCLILGMDAFLELPSWHRWRSLLDLAHIVVAHRPGWRAPEQGELGRLLERRRAAGARDLHDAPFGKLHVEPVTQLDISSTELRQSIAEGLEPTYLLPDDVREIIVETQCYARDARQDPHA